MSSNSDEPTMTMKLDPGQLKALADALKPPDDPTQSFTRLIAPFLGGFTLATIPQLAFSKNPSQPWRDIALILLVVAAGLLLAGFQLTIGRWKDRESQLRSPLGLAGVAAIGVALTILVVRSEPAVTMWGWMGLALTFLIVCTFVPMILRVLIYIRQGKLRQRVQSIPSDVSKLPSNIARAFDA